MDIRISIDGHVRPAPDGAEAPHRSLSRGLGGDSPIHLLKGSSDRPCLLLGPGHTTKVQNHRDSLLHCPRIGRVDGNPHRRQGVNIFATVLLHIGYDQVRPEGLNRFEVWILLPTDLGLLSDTGRRLGTVAGHAHQTFAKAQDEKGLSDARDEGDDSGRENGKAHAPPRCIHDVNRHKPTPLPRTMVPTGGCDGRGRDGELFIGN